LAAGNGMAALPTSTQWAGLAPSADLLIVKMTSEGAPAHSGQPAENPFQRCTSQALHLVMQEATVLQEPIVALMDSGTQWGSIDGTSAVSQRIDTDFLSTTAGHVYVAASGDEGTLPNHARMTYSTTAGVFKFTKTMTDAEFFQMWYTGSVPANVTLKMNDTGAAATVNPGNNRASSTDNSIVLCTYLPGQQFYPWTSSGPDGAVWMNVNGHMGAGSITIQATQSGSGTAEAYGDATIPAPIISYTNHITDGRLTDYSSTTSAIVDGCFNVRTSWTDIDGNAQSLTNEGVTGALWLYSSGGPTRDGRSPTAAIYGGVDITTPGGNSFAGYSPTSYWGDPTLFPFNLIQGGNGFYGRHSATSASAPIAVGAVALLLHMNPQLTGEQIRTYIHQSAVADKFTGTTPNDNWGTGKLSVLGAADMIAESFHTNPVISPSTLTFRSQPVGTTSAAMTVTFSNTGSGATDPLGITSVATTGNFHVKSNNCGARLGAGQSRKIKVTFKPTQKGTRTGVLTIKDFNVNGPQTVSSTGTGSLRFARNLRDSLFTVETGAFQTRSPKELNMKFTRLPALLAIFLALSTAVVAEDKAVTLQGTLVDSKCYLMDSKLTGNDHGIVKKCGTLCLKGGSPGALLTKDNHFYALLTPSIALAPYVGQQIRVTGRVVSGSVDVDKAEVSQNGQWTPIKLGNMM
jgi:hypothetical protein